MKQYFVYIAHSFKSGIFYVGYTNNIEQRLRDHNSGRTKSLRGHIPLEIVKVEVYTSRIDAMRREKQIKGFKSGNAFKRLIENL